MKIKTIEIVPIRVPYWRPIPIHIGVHTLAENLVVKIAAEGGEIGLGEVSPLIPSYSGETQDTALYVIYRVLAPLLIDKNPMDIKSIWRMMDEAIVGHTCAKAGIDVALHDLKAKLLGVPLYDLLGGKIRDKLPVLWTISWGRRKQEMVEEALKYINNGYQHLKIKIGSTFKRDIDNVKAIRNAVGDNISIIVDANQAYGPQEALKVIDSLKDYHTEVVEQPVPRWDILGSRFVAEKSDIPIMVDEGISTPEDAINYAKLNSADMFLIKVMRLGGLYKSRQIVDIAKRNNIGTIACSMTELGIGTAANAHFAAAIRYLNDHYGFGFDGPLQIFGITESSGFDKDIVIDTPRYEHGHLYIPEGSGLGVKLHEENIERYRSGKIRKIGR